MLRGGNDRNSAIVVLGRGGGASKPRGNLRAFRPARRRRPAASLRRRRAVRWSPRRDDGFSDRPSFGSAGGSTTMGTTCRFLGIDADVDLVLQWFRQLPEAPDEATTARGLILWFRTACP